MINNRQNGRRRGRGGGGPRPNAPSGGNRQDNRSRGNAAQLHEKFKAMARDAQLGGDRVQTEYYLQFADHYFRVLNENRPRFEEPRRSQGDYMAEDDEDGDEAGFDGDEGDERLQQQQQQQQRYEREPRPRREYAGSRDGGRDGGRDDQPRGDGEQPRPERGPRDHHAPRDVRESRPEEGERPDRIAREDGQRRPPRRRERQFEGEGNAPASAPAEPRADGNGEGRLSLDVLPPAIASDVAEIKPRRRARRPRPEDEPDIAPAA